MRKSLVEGAGPRDLVIVLVSGGGSALLELLGVERVLVVSFATDGTDARVSALLARNR